MDKDFSSSVRKHSRKQLEIKVEYPLNEKLKKSVFFLNFYYFFPSQLHVNEKRIGVADFLNNTLVNTRFSSPLMPLEKVIDTEFHLSPLIRIENLLSFDEVENRNFHSTLFYELQTLCNLYRAETRNFVKLMRREIRKGNRGEIYRKRISDMLITIKAFLDRFRLLHTRFLDPHILDDERTALRWADESISIITENGFISLYQYCKSVDDSGELHGIIENFIEQEYSYRESMNYKYQYDSNDELSGEAMAYRESILKKWSQSAMYMNVQSSHTPKRISQMIAGFAAATAMIFAVLITIFAENFFPRNSSYWIMVIVLSYVLKDRIKDIVKISFGNMLPRLTSDQQSVLIDPASKIKVGKSSGTVRFGSSISTPPEIQKIRYKAENPFRKILPPNDIVHYRRIVKLKTGLLQKNHSRLDSITEIIRFQVDNWLKEMDDSSDLLYRLENGKKLIINGNRVYRVHLVLAMKEGSGKIRESFHHYNLILNKSGIIRIDKNEI